MPRGTGRAAPSAAGVLGLIDGAFSHPVFGVPANMHG
jgi:hypothetical protein